MFSRSGPHPTLTNTKKQAHYGLPTRYAAICPGSCVRTATMASIHQQRQQHHQQTLLSNSSTGAIDLSSTVLSSITDDPILLERAVRNLRHGYAYSSFEKVSFATLCQFPSSPSHKDN